MSSPIVRQYKASDFPTVKKIFIAGCHEHAYSSFKHALRQPHNWFLILLGFLLPLVTIGSILLAILDVVVVLAVLWLCARKFFYDFVPQSLESDLKDITKYYVQREGYNFWVVESDGEVVGMVAALPSYLPGGEKNTELKRMFVTPSQRGKGIAKVLCMTIIEFARKKKCNAVVLGTTTVQTSAMYLYRDTMSSPIVRQYKPSDFPIVKKIFIAGCHEHAYPSFKHALRQPHNWLLILLGFLLPLVTTGSILLAILDVVVVLAVLWLCARKFFYDYIPQCLESDLKDITKYYVQREGYNFWVVESDGEVVGMVAAIPSYLPGGEKNTELKRMNVAPSQRGKGIAKVLCMTIIEFARKKKCNAVVLGTTTVQTSAMYLYRSMGFRYTHTSNMTKFTERLVGMQWIYFRYDIQNSK